MARGMKKEKELTVEERLEQALVPVEEQPYSVPANWCWVTLATVCKNIRAGGDKPTTFSEEKTSKTQIPIVANGTHNEGIIGYTDVASEESGTVTVAGRGTIGFSLVRNYSYYPVIRLIVIQPYNIVLPTYIKYIFDCFEEKGTGSSIPQLTVPVISTKKIPISPLAEQQRIVDRIESLFAKLDEAKEKAQAVVDGFETRKAAILHKAFTGELTAKWRQENNLELSSWENVPFDECILKMQNGLAKRNGTNGTLYVVLRLANLSEDGFNTEDLREIVLDEKEQLSYALKQNDVIMIRVNGSKDNVGKQFLITTQENWAFCDHIIRIVYKENIQPKFMIYFSKSEKYRLYIKENMVSSAGQNTISRKGMAKLIVPLPTLPEQKEIVSMLDNLLNKEQQAKEAAEAVLDQIETMKKSILARAFRGELGTNDPAEESAVELLKQV